MACKKCGCEVEVRYIDSDSNKKYAYIVSECNDCGEIIDKVKMQKVAHKKPKAK